MMQQVFAIGLLIFSIGGLVRISKTEEFKDILVILKFRLIGLKGIVSVRDYLIDVEPTQMKAIEFLEGGIEGRVVFFGPFNGNAKRILLLWKNQKHRCIRMDDKSGLTVEMMDDLYRESVEEAREIAIKVFQKRKAKSHTATEQAPPRQFTETRAVQAPPAPARETSRPPVCNVEQQASPAPKPVLSVGSGTPIIKGFKAQYAGKMVSAKMEPHVKTSHDGSSEEYTTFTMTLDTEAGVERLTGNDLRRAMVAANVEDGDDIRVLYLRDQDLPSGFKKKQYQIINLSKRKECVI